LYCTRVFSSESGVASHIRHSHFPEKTHEEIVKSIREAYGTSRKEGEKSSGIITPSLIKFSMKNNNICYWCNREVKLDLSSTDPLAPSRDHIIPRSKGGGKGTNLVLSHVRCNTLRNLIDPDAFKRLMNGEALTAAEMWPDWF